MAKDILPITPLTTEGAGFDLAAAAIRKATGATDAMSGKVQFKAVVLKPLGGRMSPQAKAGIEGTAEPISKNDRRGNYYGYRVRIIEENSPHIFIPDPCTPQTPGPKNKTLMDMHTVAWSREQLNFGDEVIIRLDRRDYSYDLEFCYVAEVGMQNAQRYSAGEKCSQAVDQSMMSLESVINDSGGNSPIDYTGNGLSAIRAKVGGPSNANAIMAAYPAVAAQQGLAQKIVQVASNLQIQDPGWLANLINFETGGTFDAAMQNTNGSDCWGLIQFCRDSGAKNVGQSWEAGSKPPDELIGRGAVHQMDYVEKYLAQFKGKLNSQVDLYAAVFYPASLSWGPDFNIYEHIYYRTDKGGGPRMAQVYLEQNSNSRGEAIVYKGDYLRLANGNSNLPTVLPGSS